MSIVFLKSLLVRCEVKPLFWLLSKMLTHFINPYVWYLLLLFMSNAIDYYIFLRLTCSYLMFNVYQTKRWKRVHHSNIWDTWLISCCLFLASHKQAVWGYFDSKLCGTTSAGRRASQTKSREWLVRCCARSSSFHQFSVCSLGLQGLQRKAFSQEVRLLACSYKAIS